MHYRTFGRTNWQISVIGFGAWQLGGTWGDVSESEAIEILDTAEKNEARRMRDYDHRTIPEVESYFKISQRRVRIV